MSLHSVQTKLKAIAGQIEPTEPMRWAPLPGTVIVSLSHKARQGKDVVAAKLNQKLTAMGWRVQTYRFADPLKAFCRVAANMTTKDAPLLQWVGTDLMRARDPQVWLRSTYFAIAEERSDVALITDCRFPNEAELVRAAGGLLVRVRRIDNGVQFIAPDRDANHPSETALDGWTDWDFDVVAASGDMAALDEYAHHIATYVEGRLRS